jgi:hypothetical protein
MGEALIRSLSPSARTLPLSTAATLMRPPIIEMSPGLRN